MAAAETRLEKAKARIKELLKGTDGQLEAGGFVAKYRTMSMSSVPASTILYLMKVHNIELDGADIDNAFRVDADKIKIAIGNPFISDTIDRNVRSFNSKPFVVVERAKK